MLILASTSRYRRELLARLVPTFEVVSPGVDETPLAGEAPRALAARLAFEKARAVAARHPGAVVIGSDQVATLDDVTPIGKPGSHPRAVAQLRAASGRAMRFHTGLAVVCRERGVDAGAIDDTTVRFRALSDDEIEDYLLREQPYDVAGAAKSEGLGIALLEAIETRDPTALIGLPLIALGRLLAQAGVPLLGRG